MIYNNIGNIVRVNTAERRRRIVSIARQLIALVAIAVELCRILDTQTVAAEIEQRQQTHVDLVVSISNANFIQVSAVPKVVVALPRTVLDANNLPPSTRRSTAMSIWHGRASEESPLYPLGPDVVDLTNRSTALNLPRQPHLCTVVDPTPTD